MILKYFYAVPLRLNWKIAKIKKGYIKYILTLQTENRSSGLIPPIHRFSPGNVA